MTTYSLSDVGAEALRMGWYAPDEAISADDQSQSELCCQSAAAMLATKGIQIVNGSVEALPLEYLMPFCQYVSRVFLADYFGAPLPSQAEVLMMEAGLRRMNAKQPTGSTVAVEYF